MAKTQKLSIWEPALVRAGLVDAVRKLDPRVMIKNPVMFVVEIGAGADDRAAGARHGCRRRRHRLRTADHAVAVGHRAVRQPRRGDGRRPRQGAGRHAAQDAHRDGRQPLGRPARPRSVPAASLRTGDVVLVKAGEFIPSDGEIVEGVASVDESAITGESAPVIREAGGDRSAVTGGTRVLSDWIKVRVTADPGHTFLDRMIALVEGAERQKTPNEIALNILLAGLTIVFLMAVVTLQPFAVYSGRAAVGVRAGVAAGLPDPDDDRRTAVGDRHRRHGPADPAQRAGDVGPRGRGGRRRAHAAARQDRHDHARQPPGDASSFRSPASPRRRSPTPRSWRRWPTRRPRAGRSSCWRSRSTASAAASWRHTAAEFVPFTAQTRMSGVDLDGREIRKGAAGCGREVRGRQRR